MIKKAEKGEALIDLKMMARTKLKVGTNLLMAEARVGEL